MLPHKFHIYTDASFSSLKLIGVSGLLLFRNCEEHEAGVVDSSVVRTKLFRERTNIRVELRGVLSALEEAALEKQRIQKAGQPGSNFEIILYTDCRAVLQLAGRRKKLERDGYMSHRKKEILPNADLYREFFTLCDQLNPEIRWVKGHSAIKGRTLVQNNFRRVDQDVRKELRKVAKQTSFE